MQQEVNQSKLCELHVSHRGLGVSHLLFADDTLLFMKINAEQATVVQDALRCYERCTCQLISPRKCLIMFGAHCQQENMERVKEILSYKCRM
jgi:hypothetical protein